MLLYDVICKYYNEVVDVTLRLWLADEKDVDGAARRRWKCEYCAYPFEHPFDLR